MIGVWRARVCDQHEEHAGRGARTAAFPLRVRRQRLRRGSGGTGAHVGGDGIERDLEVLVDVTVSLITERRRVGPWGWRVVARERRG